MMVIMVLLIQKTDPLKHNKGIYEIIMVPIVSDSTLHIFKIIVKCVHINYFSILLRLIL